MTETKTPSGFKMKGATVDIGGDKLVIWANQPLSAPGSAPSTVNFWEANNKQPEGMTPDGALLWRVFSRLFDEMNLLGVTYCGGIEPRHITLRVAPGSDRELPPDIVEGEKLAAQAHGDKYRLLQGLDFLVGGLSTMTGMSRGAELVPQHDNYVYFDTGENEFALTANGNVVIRAVIRDIIDRFNQALDALRGDNP